MLFSDKYREVEGQAECIWKSKGSKFLAYAFSVHGEEEIKQHLSALRHQYPDATHHCYAWVLGYDRQNFRSNDDGEPAGTAGKPILRQLQKLELTNTLVVVVRYFGGTLLGVPGLIEAYSEAAKECLQLCKQVEKTVYEKYHLSCEFGTENEIYKLGKQYNAAIVVKDTNDRFSAEIKIPLLQSEQFKKQLQQHYQINYQYTGIA